MTDTVFSIKTPEGYKNVVTIKQGQYGVQVAITPDGHKILKDYFLGDPAWLNLNKKDFPSRTSAATPQKPAAPAPVELDDEIPF